MPADAHTMTNGSRKKKSKKGKGKREDGGVLGDRLHGDSDDMPSLEYTSQTTRVTSRMGLPPDIESVHLSASAQLKSAAAVATLNATAAAQQGLLDLYQRLDADTAGGFSDEQDYLGSLPAHIRNFVEDAWARISSAESDEQKQRTMYALAHQMAMSAPDMINGMKEFPGYPGLPGDPTAPIEAQLELSWQHPQKKRPDPMMTRGRTMASPGHPPRGPVPPPPGSREFLGNFAEVELGYEEDDMYSEDEVDDHVEDDDEDLGMMGMPGTLTPLNGPTYMLGKKKSKKKRRKGKGTGNSDSPSALVPTPTAPQPPSMQRVPAAVPARTAPVHTPPGHQKKESVTGAVTEPNPNPMPAVRQQSANPPPSSRAAGKQPMSYSPAAPATAPATNNSQQPVRSARAASKAPVPAHSYPQQQQHHPPHHHPSPPSSNASAPQKHRPPNQPQPQTAKRDKIWSTSSSEERERIKEFWLGLGEEERRALVKVEKEAVLRKMKEQQRHSCTCAVCGRKRNAIEEELEVLYDAYYEELEQYANYQQQYASSGGTLPPPPGPGPFPGSVAPDQLDHNGAIIPPGRDGKTYHPAARGKGHVATNGRKKNTESEFDEDEQQEHEEYEEEDYADEDEEEEDEEEDDLASEDLEVRGPNARRAPARGRHPNQTIPAKANGRDDPFGFGLTAAGPGNILTVADDLLKNDGQKFLEMMEQLAERRMQKEEEAAADIEDDSEEDDEDLDDEDEEDEDEDDDEDDDEDEVMTEEQKMEEGKKMFSIFAARMFEQRVLQAYREKVAQERQQQLLRELEDEDKLTKEREAKKQKENQKKKDKKKQAKLAKEEERAARAAEKAAEEASQREKQRLQEEEQKRKKEDERLKREALRKSQDEERQRKEEERRKRLAEEKEREVERERKRKEKEEKVKAERREREEKERKVREEKEAKLAAERAEKAKREQQEKEERERRLNKEREEKAEREAKERLALQNQQRAAAAAAKPRSPTSPRSNSVSSAVPPRVAPLAPKKILNKPTPVVAPAPPVRQPSRPSVATSQPATPVTTQAQPQQIVQGSAPPVAIPLTPLYSPNGPPSAPALTTRNTFPTQPATGFQSFPPISVQQIIPPPLAPSALPRSIGNGFDPSIGRVPATPIGPPSKIGLPNPIGSPIGSSMPIATSTAGRGQCTPLGTSRRRSSTADPGPITRPLGPIGPIGPIARPSVEPSSSGSRSGATSPSRRSPSPKGVLGSAALAADDDEVVQAAPRRVTAPVAPGAGWHSPRSSIIPTSWGQPVAPFGSPRPLSGSTANMWGTAPAANGDWHPHAQASNYFGNPFTAHSSSPPPHNGA